MRSRNKARALFAENKVRFARAEELWSLRRQRRVYYVRDSVPCIVLIQSGSEIFPRDENGAVIFEDDQVSFIETWEVRFALWLLIK